MTAGARGHAGGCFERGGVLLPLTGNARDRFLHKDLACVVVQQPEVDRRAGLGSLSIKGSLIGGAGPQRNAPIALVLHARRALRVRGGHLKLEAVRDGRAGTGLVDGQVGTGGAALEEAPIRGTGKPGRDNAIAQQLPVQAAVVGEVDLLRHQAVERRARLRLRLARVDGERHRLRLREKRGCEEESKQRGARVHRSVKSSRLCGTSIAEGRELWNGDCSFCTGHLRSAVPDLKALTTEPRKPDRSSLQKLVDLIGIEPMTSSMPWKRAPSCATGPLTLRGGASSILPAWGEFVNRVCGRRDFGRMKAGRSRFACAARTWVRSGS